jgi:hypothetical protein
MYYDISYSSIGVNKSRILKKFKDLIKHSLHLEQYLNI